jgi:hypothetical protein
VLPGLIDVHTHLTGNPDFDPYRELTSTNAKEAINGVVNARATLMAGITSVRNVGAGGYTDVDLRDAINAGQVPGPHMLVSGPLWALPAATATITCCRFNITRWATAWPTALPRCSTRCDRTLNTGPI